MPRKKLRSLKALKREADQVFAKWIRLRGSVNGFNTCVTCGAVKSVSEGNAGHFWKRQHLAVRFDPRNTNFQCVFCNHYQSGREAEHAAYILRTYGKEVFEELETLHNQVCKLSRADYEAIIEKYST